MTYAAFQHPGQADLSEHEAVYSSALESFRKSEMAPSDALLMQAICGSTNPMRVNVVGNEYKFRMIDAFPQWEEFKGERTSGSLRYHEQSIKIKEHTVNFPWDVNRIKSDPIGLFAETVDLFFRTRVASYRPWRALAALAANPTGYDGVGIFSSSHPYGPAGATQDNTTSGSVTVATHRAIIEAMQGLQDEVSEPYSYSPNIVIAPVGSARDFMNILEVDSRPVGMTAAGVMDASASIVAAATQATNIYRGEMTLVVSPRVASNKAYYIDGTSPVSPLRELVVEEPVNDSQTDPQSDSVYFRRLATFGLSARDGYGAGFWQCIHELTIT